MTDYPHTRRNSWKKQEVARKWRSLLGIFMTAVLIFAAINGIARTLSIGKFFGRSNWEGKAAFWAAFATKPLSVLIYNPTAHEISLVKLSEDLYFVTGDSREPLAEIGKVSESAGGLITAASRITRSPIRNFVILKEREEASRESLEKYFKSFASLFTPIRILVAKPTGILDTNITRVDMIRLWWQVKSLSLNNLNFVDATGLSQEIVTAGGYKILGVDDVSIHRLISKYLQNWTVLEEQMAVSIDDFSGEAANGSLARDFVLAIGGDVTGISQKSDERVEKTFIAAGRDSYTASYLAKVFECDIKALPSVAEGEVKVVVGQDFGQKF
ncbi:hypothetical protein HYZ70_00420 [Candidatus Curtissbacteria bacterium]|nr:hypothetical protein [Candidatus Curtissbacteria bacterium]